MVTRTAQGYTQLLRDNYSLLKDAVEGFYTGKYEKAIEIAVRLRTLVHQSDGTARPGRTPSTPLLSFIDSEFLKRTIYHKVPEYLERGDTVAFSLNQEVRISSDSVPHFVRSNFTSDRYRLVPLEQWWTQEYLALGMVRSSKKQIALDIANKDGGVHVDADVPLRHAMASEPPVVFGKGDKEFYRLNFARGVVADAGNELLEFIERNYRQTLADLLLPLTIEVIEKVASQGRWKRMPLADPIRVVFSRGENFINLHRDGKWAFYSELKDGKKPDRYGIELDSLHAFLASYT